MTDLVEWLETAISEREQAAGEASPGPWETGGIGDYGWTMSGTYPFGVETEDSEQGKADARFIALNNPKVELRRCLTDRKVLAHHRMESVDPDRLRGFCAHCGWRFPCPDIRHLAEGYGYQEVAVHD